MRVLCGHWAPWATQMDRKLLVSRRWSCRYVDGDPVTKPLAYWHTRVRHGLSRRLIRRWKFRESSLLRRWALCRILPELEREALRTPADLYIAHYPGALPAAVNAARKHKAKVGFDAEDFHTEFPALGECTSVEDCLVEEVERTFLPECDYITASSPFIAEAYENKYRIPRPTTILNVFPLSMRPASFRPTRKDRPLRIYWFSQTIGKQRGLEDAVRAMGALPGYDIELHLQGVPATGYLNKLLELATSTGANPNKVVVHLPVPPDDLIQIAAEYDVGLALEPGRDANNKMALSNKIFVYLLAGNAVVATATKAQRLLMADIPDVGFCYEPGDVDALARCLKRWYEDRNALDRARRQAWDWGSRRYNWDIEKKKFLEVIERILRAV